MFTKLYRIDLLDACVYRHNGNCCGIVDNDLTANGVIVDDGGPSLPMSKKGDLNGDVTSPPRTP